MGSRRPGNRPDEAETPPVHGFDVTRRVGRIPERLAQIANAGGQGGLAHDRVTPDPGQQLLLRDQSPRVVDQVP